MTAAVAASVRTNHGAQGLLARQLSRAREIMLPLLALAAVMGAIVAVNGDVLSYTGLNLLFASAVPLVFACVSQGLIIGLGDIDLGLGFFVGLANAAIAVFVVTNPALGLVCLMALVFGYVLLGLLISLRRVPAIIVTLGASFVWLGLGQMILPTPGGSEPGWLANFFASNPPLVPLPVWLIIATGTASYLLLFRSRVGLMLRGAGSNEAAYRAAGWRVVRARVVTYALAAVFAILAAVAVTGVTASGDPMASANYTLLAIAGVILGGGSFSGGRVSAVGMVAGALVISLIGSLLGLISVPSSLQTGAQGLVLLAVIAGRRFWSEKGR